MSEPIQAVIYDMGSTLMYFDGEWEEAIRRGAASMAAFFTKKRVELDEAQLAEIFVAQRAVDRLVADDSWREVTCRQSLQTALEKVDAPPSADPWVTEAVRVCFQPEEAGWKEFSESRDVLKHLNQKGYRQGLLSNASDDFLIQRLVNRMGFRPYLSPAFSSAGLGLRKPDPEPFELIRSGWNVPAQSVVMVGDRLNADILGARQAGMRSVLITADEQEGVNDPHRDSILPDATITAISQLPAVIEAWSG